MPDTRKCCLLEICCSPPQAAKAFAAKFNVSEETATAVLEEFRLVPRDAVQEVHSYLDERVRTYLVERNLPVTAEEPRSNSTEHPDSFEEPRVEKGGGTPPGQLPPLGRASDFKEGAKVRHYPLHTTKNEGL